MGSEDEVSDESEYDDDPAPPPPRDMITDAKHFSRCELGGAETLDRYLSCPICLGIMSAPTATECLHRFCSECIETSLRIGKKECPSCRYPIATRRALRRDYNFEALMRTLYPEGDPASSPPTRARTPAAARRRGRGRGRRRGGRRSGMRGTARTA